MKRHQLDPWQEIHGFLHAIEIEDDVVIATFSSIYSLRYPCGSYEANFFVEHLNKENIGRDVSILKTENDLRILWRDELPKSNEPSPFWIWFLNTYGYVDE